MIKVEIKVTKDKPLDNRISVKEEVIVQAICNGNFQQMRQ